MISARSNGPSCAFGAVRSDGWRGTADTRWLVVAGLTAVVVAVGIVKFRNGGDELVEDAIKGTAPADLAGNPVVAVQPPAMAEEIVSRVDAAEVFQPAVQTDEGASHIGPRADPLLEPYDPGGASPSHIGRRLDPDREYATSAGGEASHIGEYLDPVADE